MTENAVPLTMFYQGWETYHQSLVETTEPLSPEQLALPVAPHHWSIGMVLNHVIGSRVFWFQRWLGEGDPNLAHWDEDQQSVRTAAELVAGLSETWRLIAEALASFTPADLGRIFPTPDFLTEEERQFFPPQTLQWIIWHTIEHEIHHGGELSLALGGLGLPGVYGNA
jgi:uncharacterized damage-inducible protein DinB